MASSGGGASSNLSTDSPPFNPRGMGSMNSLNSQASPAPMNHNRSRSASSVSNSSISAVDTFSNAIPKHTFQYEKYVMSFVFV